MKDHAAGASQRKMKSRYGVCRLRPMLRYALER
jgi:hypothetical protein